MLRIRELEPAEADVLGVMLYAALYWDPAAERPPAEFVLAHPRVTIFDEGWGRRLSLASIATIRRSGCTPASGTPTTSRATVSTA
jgi:hypothetical protein